MVDQDVSVSQEEDALLLSGLPKPPNDLKGGVGLAGASGHDQEDSVLPLCDGFQGAVDGLHLVVTGFFTAWVEVVVLGNCFLVLIGQAPRLAVPLPKNGRSGETIKRNFLFDLFGCSGSVMDEE